MPTAEQYWKALQERVCSKCIDGDGAGGCRIAPERECALKLYLPQILEAVGSIYGNTMQPYEEQLRNKVCGTCIHHSPDGSCHLRDDVECALDRYYPMIVSVIEETQLRERLRQNP
jgi:hypothetical protein